MTRLNESALQNAQKLYTMAMNDWLKNEVTPFSSMNQLRDQHHSIKESVKIDARNKWEGRDFITYEIRLQEVRFLQKFSIEFYNNWLVT